MSAMQTGLVRSLLFVLGVRCLVGCSLPEAAAASHESTAKDEPDNTATQREIDRRRHRQQRQVLNDLRQLRAGATEQASLATPEPSAEKLLVFGGASHEVFLGCLCKERDPDSVFNLAGDFGSDTSGTSMHNKFSPYGSNFEDTSACNPKATHPPSVLSADGKSLGLLTMNASLKKRIEAPSVVEWLARMCRL